MKRPTKKDTRNYRQEPLYYEDGGAVPYPMADPRNDYRKARRDLKDTPPVTVMEDIVGRFSDSKAHSNAVRDAIRRGAVDTIKQSRYED